MEKSSTKRLLSMTEAEYIAGCEGRKEAIWLSQLLSDTGARGNDAIPINIYNQSAIRIIKNRELYSRSKHIETKFHFIRKAYNSKKVPVNYVPSNDRLADIFTKPLSKDKFISMIPRLGMRTVDNKWELEYIVAYQVKLNRRAFAYEALASTSFIIISVSVAVQLSVTSF